jgi:hypothetical protein
MKQIIYDPNSPCVERFEAALRKLGKITKHMNLTANARIMRIEPTDDSMISTFADCCRVKLHSIENIYI